MTGKGKYLLVRVRNAPDRSATALQAVMTVLAGGMYMMRRVGSPGMLFLGRLSKPCNFGRQGMRKRKWLSLIAHPLRKPKLSIFGTLTFSVTLGLLFALGPLLLVDEERL